MSIPEPAVVNLKRRLNKKLKILLYVCVPAFGLFLLAGVGLWLYEAWPYHLPSEARVRQQFESQRIDFIRFATLLQKDRSAKHIGDDGKVEYIGDDGRVDSDGTHERLVPEYRDLVHKLGAKFVIIREDGSMEFALWGNGGAIMSDSYMGVRYFPGDQPAISAGWKQTVVASLASAKLPQENGAVATGLFVVPVEPKWFIHRFEYQE
jgi:hypothetical protein